MIGPKLPPSLKFGRVYHKVQEHADKTPPLLRIEKARTSPQYGRHVISVSDSWFKSILVFAAAIVLFWFAVLVSWISL